MAGRKGCQGLLAWQESVLLNLALSWDSLIANVSRSAFRHLSLIAHLQPYLDRGSLKTLVQALVLYRIDYYYMGLPLRRTWRSLQVQRLCGRQIGVVNVILSLQFWLVSPGYLLYPESGSEQFIHIKASTSWDHVPCQNVSPQSHLPDPPDLPRLSLIHI